MIIWNIHFWTHPLGLEKYIDSSLILSTVSLENVLTDLAELEKGMDVVRREAEQRGNNPSAVSNTANNGASLILRDFLANAEEKLRRLKTDVRNAQETFRDCVELFGESPRTTDANAFFSLFVRFARSFKVSYPSLLLPFFFLCKSSDT